MDLRSRPNGVTRSVAAAAAILLFAAGCNGSAGGSAAPTSGASASTSTAPASNPAATPGIEGTALEVLDFTLEPLTLSVEGTDVVLDVTNAGPTVHNVTIRDDAGAILAFTRDLREGEADSVTATLAPDTYVLFCSLPGHESLGIKGTLDVTAP